MDVEHLPLPHPLHERDSFSEIGMDVEHLTHPMSAPQGIAFKMFMGYGLCTPLRPYIIVLTHTKTGFFRLIFSLCANWWLIRC